MPIAPTHHPTDLRFPAPDGVILQVRAGLLCVHAGNLLTCWDARFPDFHFLPGGAVMTGESAEAAARREWREEVGVAGAAVQLCGVVENFFDWDGSVCHEFGFFFRVMLTGELPPMVLDNPHVTFHWLPITELERHTLYPTCISKLLEVPAGGVGHFVTDTRA